jgi:hypothetical protein
LVFELTVLPSVSDYSAFSAETLETGIENTLFVQICGTGARGIASRGSNPAAPTNKEARRRETGRRAFGFGGLLAGYLSPLKHRLWPAR